MLSTAPGSLLQVSSIRIGKDYGGVAAFRVNDLQRKSGAISPYWWGHFTVEVGPIHTLKWGHFTVDNLLHPQEVVENGLSRSGAISPSAARGRAGALRKRLGYQRVTARSGAISPSR